MPERVREVKKIEYYDLLCDECGVEMEFDYMREKMFDTETNLPVYPHICPKCGKEELTHNTYPYQKMFFIE